MKKLLLIMLAMACLPAMAEQRSASQALDVASSYLRSGASHHLLGVNQHAPQLSLAKTAVSAGNKVDYYVFNNSKDRGFIIVSGDDKAAPVLGYSDSGSFDENDIPDGMRYWLDCYAEQMQYLRSHPESAYVAPRSQSNVLITPLLTCNWNQNTPYNNMCPTYSNGTLHAATGCAITAFAQVMNYHKWPKKGTGSYTYECNVNGEGNQTLSADFGSTTYDWDNMLDNYVEGNYTTVQGNAVATLMSHLGIASRTKFGASSGTSVLALVEALRTYFGYNKAMGKYSRASVPVAKWDSLIMNELLNSRPVIYAGLALRGAGHCFVLDGCNTDGFYHFNWGWGGRYNGYFLTTALNPRDQETGCYETGYNSLQEIVTNLYPDKGEPEPENFIEATCDRFWPGTDQANLGDEAPIYINNLQFNGYGYGLNAYIYLGLQLTDEDGDIVDFTEGNNINMNFSIGSGYNWDKEDPLEYLVPEDLDDGDYKLWAVYKLRDSDMTEYAYLNNDSNVPNFINVKVEDGVMYFSESITRGHDLSVTHLMAPDDVGAGTPFVVTATIANAGKDYCGDVYFNLCKDGKSVEIYDGIRISVLSGDKVSFRTMLTAPGEAGAYELLILDKELYTIGGGTITLNVVSNSNYNLEIETPLQVASYYMDMDDVEATAVIRNTGTGDYVGPIPYMILSADEKTVVASRYTETVTIPAGGSTTVNIKTAFEGVPALVYKMCLRDLTNLSNNTEWGDLVPFELNSISESILLSKLLDGGIVDGDYRLADNLTIADSHDQSIFATDGRGSWIELKCGDNFDTVKAMNALKAGTVWGKYYENDGNPSITLTKVPEAGVEQPDVVEKLDLSKTFTLVSAQVIEFTGFYSVENGAPVVYAHDGSDGDKGVAMPISFDWLPESVNLDDGECYDFHGVVQLIPAAIQVPSLKDDDTTPAGFTVFLTKSPTSFTAIDRVNSDAAKVSIASGAIQVAGASRVAVYNLAGALVGTGNYVQLPAGIYIVVADSVMHKIIVK